MSQNVNYATDGVVQMRSPSIPVCLVLMSKGCKIYCVNHIKFDLIVRCCQMYCAVSSQSSSVRRAVNLSENKVSFLQIDWLLPVCSRVAYKFTITLGSVSFESCGSPGRSSSGTSRRPSAPGHGCLGRAEQFWTIAIGSLEPCASQNLSYFLTVGVEVAETRVVLYLFSTCPPPVLTCPLPVLHVSSTCPHLSSPVLTCPLPVLHLSSTCPHLSSTCPHLSLRSRVRP